MDALDREYQAILRESREHPEHFVEVWSAAARSASAAARRARKKGRDWRTAARNEFAKTGAATMARGELVSSHKGDSRRVANRMRAKERRNTGVRVQKAVSNYWSRRMNGLVEVNHCHSSGPGHPCSVSSTPAQDALAAYNKELKKQGKRTFMKLSPREYARWQHLRAAAEQEQHRQGLSQMGGVHARNFVTDKLILHR